MRFNWFGKVVALIIAVELLSWLAYANPEWQSIIFLVITAAVLGISLWKLEYGVYAVMAELVVGSQGYLVSLPLGGFNLSLRLGLFLILMLAGLVSVVRTKKVYFFASPFWKLYVAFWTFLAIGVAVGWLFGNSLSNIFFDWNGYLFFGAAIVFPQALRTKQHIKHVLLVVFAGVTVLALQTVFILFLFSHTTAFTDYLPATYSWIRDFRIGEITRQPNGFYRVFFQSHIYVLYALCLALAYSVYRWKAGMVVLLGVAPTLIFLSYSRSFWVSCLAVLAAFAVIALWKLKVPFKRLVGVYVAMGALTVVGYVFALGVINIPLPSGSGSGVSAASLISERTQDPTQEAAGSSRMALLKPLIQKNLEHPIIGSGFGTTVTYATADPRALADNPDGLYTTYAFEWGYLDLWLKLGVAGVFVYGLLLLLIILRGYELVTQKSTKESVGSDNYIIIGAVFGVLGIIIVHALTPYLNHPLGIGWILFTTSILDVYGKK